MRSSVRRLTGSGIGVPPRSGVKTQPLVRGTSDLVARSHRSRTMHAELDVPPTVPATSLESVGFPPAGRGWVGSPRRMEGGVVLEADEAADIEEVQAWAAGLDALHVRIAGRFARAEPRRRALAYLRGLLGNVGRKNGWQLAEYAGERTPDGMQRLLATAGWDPELVRDDLRAYVVEHLGDPGAVLVVDETGFLKKGTTSVGVQRQYSGTAGKVDNCQLGVFLAYASPKGRAFIDRELYLPECWTDDPERCRAARVPEQVGFRTKPQLAQLMLERALDAGVSASWVTADEVYGGSPTLRGWLEGRGVSYVLAVKCTEPLVISGPDGPVRATAERLAAAVPAEQWVTASAGQGAKGRRLYDWTRIQLATPTAGMARWLLVRRSRRDGELAFYACYSAAATPLVGL